MLVLVSLLSLIPQAETCRFPEVVAGGPSPTKLGSWIELAKVLAPDAHATTEAAAVKAACDHQPGCDARTLVVCDDEADMTCYVRAPSGPWHGFATGFSQFDGTGEVDARLSPDQRYLAVMVSHELLGRDEEAMCEVDEDGVANCLSATVSYGYAYADYVIQLDAMKVVWSAAYDSYDELAQGKNACKRPHDIGFDGAAFTRTSCLGATERFTHADLTPCTEATRKAAVDARDAARAKVTRTRNDADTKRLDAIVDRGRKLTRDKDYAGAIAAFDEALRVEATKPTALSGRGYARLMRGQGDDLDKAAIDLRNALAYGPDDAKFRGAVMFNLGLVAEKQKSPDAKAWFEKSHAANPSAATKKKLGLP